MPAGDRPVRAPLPPLKKMHISDKGSGQATELFTSQQQSMWNWVSRGIPTMPSDVGGTANAIVLTPNLTPNNTIPNYLDYMPFAFMATATSTGPVTVNVSGGGSTLGAKPLYTADLNGNFSQVGAGAILTGNFYVVYFAQALNGGDGGFLLTAPASTKTSTAWQLVTLASLPTGVNNYVLTGLGSYTELLVLYIGVTDAFGRVANFLQVSSDNGATWYTANYSHINNAGQTSVFNGLRTANNIGTSGEQANAYMRISAFGDNALSPFMYSGTSVNNSYAGYIGLAAPYNAIKLFTASNLNYTGGVIQVLGLLH